MSEPAWLVVARQQIGQREIPGPASSPFIRDLWMRLRGGAWYWSTFGQDDSRLPWCGAFVAGALDTVGLAYPKDYARARAWITFGEPLGLPRLGCIAVFERGAGGHVGFVVGEYPDGRLAVLGGNQGDTVSIAPFDRRRVLAYRWPERQAPVAAGLPLLAATRVASSRNEA